MIKRITNRFQIMVIFNAIARLIAGLLVLMFGVLLLVKQSIALDILVVGIEIVFILVGVANIINWIIKKPRVLNKIVLPILTLGIGILLLFFNYLSLYFITFLFGLYLFISAVIEFINVILILRNKSGEFFFSLIPGIFYLVFSLIFILSPAESNETAFIIIGIYCILLGSTFILDFIYSVVPKKAKRKIKRKIKITLPVFMAMFIPYTVLEDFNRFLKKEGNGIEDRIDISDQKETQESDLEIYFHIADKGFNSVGHCDIYFEGELIAYGNYHEAAQNRIGMGPGVLILSNKEEYIPFCLEFNKTTIFSFGLRLDDEQKTKIRKQIKEIKSLVYPWDPPYAKDLKENKKIKENYSDFASELCKNTDSTFYKFKKGKFKTYFIMTTNCVALTDSIICKAGTDILGISGIISPGTLYDYLQSEYMRKGSIVIKKDVHTNRVNGQKTGNNKNKKGSEVDEKDR